MRVTNIHTSKDFDELFARCPKDMQERALKTLELFLDNPFHPSLRLHKLSGRLVGRWSISINMKYRIIFRIEGESDALLISIGTHSIYE